LKSFPHLDHGYAVTSHASQGATLDRVLINIDTTRSRWPVNRQQFYVSLSRAYHDALIFTDSREALPRAISGTADKAIALDAIDNVKLRPETDPKAGSCPSPAAGAAEENVTIGNEPKNGTTILCNLCCGSQILCRLIPIESGGVDLNLEGASPIPATPDPGQRFLMVPVLHGQLAASSVFM
jgi:hypothetical protein